MTEFAPQLKLLNHPEAIQSFVSGEWKAPPVGVEISPTNHCNAKCPWCWFVSSEYKQKHSHEELDIDCLSKSLDDMADMGVRSVTWTGGGDPSVYTWIDNAIDVAAQVGLRQGMFTNGYKPIASPRKLDWIRITITEKFTLSKHVANYAKVTKVGVNFNLCRENEHRILDMAYQAKAAGAAYFQVRPALADRADIQSFVECPTFLKNLETDAFKVVLTEYKWDDYLKPHGYPICHGHRIVPFLWHNGDLSVCAYHFGREPYVLGNIVKENGFKAVWHGERRRKMLEDGIPVISDCQHCCKLHESNKLLSALAGDKAREIADPDFI